MTVEEPPGDFQREVVLKGSLERLVMTLERDKVKGPTREPKRSGYLKTEIIIGIPT